MKNKSRRKKFWKIASLICYIICTAVLIVEASMDGKSSAGQSNAVGGTIAGIFNDIEGDQTVAVVPTAITIDNKINSAFVGTNYQLTSTVSPDNSTFKAVHYSSNNTNVATVTDDGTINFLNKGIVTITVYNEKYPDLKDEVTIDVNNIEATSINSIINEVMPDENNVYTLFLNNEYTINTTFDPVNTTFKDLTYSSSNASVVTVSNDGIIKPVKYSAEQIIDINVTHGNLINTFKVIVDYENIVPLESINIDSFEICVNQTITPKVTFYPSNATFKDYDITTTDSDLITITGNKVKGKSNKREEATIKVTSKTYPSIYDEVTIKVSEQPDITGFSASLTNTLYVGNSSKISIQRTPSYAKSGTVKYESNDDTVATVDINGTVTAIGPGETQIIISIETSKTIFTKQVTVKVAEKEDIQTTDFIFSSTLDENNHLYCGKTYNLNNIFKVEEWLPQEPSNKTLKFELEDPSFGNINGASLTLSKPGSVNLNISHTTTGITKTVLLNSTYEFNIVIEESSRNIVVGQNSYFEISDSEDNKSLQTYLIEVDNPEAISITHHLDLDHYDISALKEGETTVTIIPYIDNVAYEYAKKSITIHTNHILTDVVDFHLFNNQTAEEVIVEHKIDVSLNSSYTIIGIVSTNATISKLRYISSDENILTVNNDGTIIFHNAGVATVTVLDEVSNVSNYVDINVFNKIALNETESFKIEGSELTYSQENDVYTLTNGYSAKLKINFTEDSTYTKINYSSSNEEIATIGKDGTITPLKVGKTVITASIDDGILDPIIIELNIEIKRQDVIKDLSSFFYKIRKGIGHFGAFLVLGIFSTLTWVLFFNKKKLFFSVPVNMILGFAIAALTEIIQLYVPGRSGLFSDVLLDFSGFMCSAILISVIIIIVTIVSFVKNKKIKITQS